MLKSILVDHMGNVGFPSLRTSQQTPDQNGLFVLRVLHGSILKNEYPRVVRDEETLTAGVRDSMTELYALESGTYELQWAADEKTTVTVEYVGEPPEPRVHFRNLWGMDITYGNSGGPSALPASNAIPFPEEEN